MTMQQELDVPATIAVRQSKNAGKRIGRIGLVLIMVFSAVSLWLSYWPQLQGDYVGDAGSTKVTVTASGAGVHVEISDNASGTPKVSAYEAEKAWYTLRFGTGLDQQAIVYHPGGRYTLVTGCRTIVLSRQNWVAWMAGSHPYSLVLAVMAFMIAYMFFVLREKAKAEPEVIHPTWLAYFGALFGSAFILYAAGEKGIFGFDGEPRTSVAKAILDAALFFLDLGSEFGTLLGLLGFIVLTQWFAYLFAGLSGAARRPRFIVLAWKWVSLLIAKALISASAIVLSIEIVGGRFYWVNTEPRPFAANLLTSTMLLFFGMCVFCMVPLKKGSGQPVGRLVRRVHRCMRRRMRKGPNEVMARMQKRAMRRFPWPYLPILNACSSNCCRVRCEGACLCACKTNGATLHRMIDPDLSELKHEGGGMACRCHGTSRRRCRVTKRDRKLSTPGVR